MLGQICISTKVIGKVLFSDCMASNFDASCNSEYLKVQKPFQNIMYRNDLCRFRQ